MSKFLKIIAATAVFSFAGAVIAADTTATPAAKDASPAVTAPADASKAAPAATDNKEATQDQTAQAADNTPKVNINEADLKALMVVKGINKKHAEAIIKYRTKNGNFKSVDDLIKVKCIKKKLFDKISKNLTV